MNSAKTELMVIGKAAGTSFTVNGIKDKDTMKLIGLTFDNKLSFMPHAQNLVRQVAGKLAGLKKLCAWANFSLCVSVAKSLILSKLYRLLEVMGQSHSIQVILQKSMNHVLRVITKGNRYSSISSMLLQCDLLNVENQCRFQTYLWFRKCMLEDVSSFTRSLVTDFDSRTRSTSFKLKFIPRLKASEHSFVYQGVKIFTELNESGRIFTSTKEMKTIYRQKLLNNHANGNVV